MTSDTALSIRQVSKSFDGKKVVKDVSFEIYPGEIFGLLGPNGAGKSTLINMTAGLTRIDAGEIKIFGHDNQREQITTKRLTGVMHQEIIVEQFFKIGLALKIHAGYYGVKDDRQWRELLIERLDLGPHLNKRFLKLSGGMKRRVMVAKALIHKPRLLILDEPTAGVDVELRRSLWDFVREINAQGITVLLTTHYLEEAEQMCGRIAIMNHGELIALEKTKDLVNKVGEQQLSVVFEQAITEIPSALQQFEIKVSDDRLALSCTLPTGAAVAEVLSQIKASGKQIADITISRPDLEDVFLRLTGATTKNK